MRHSARPWDPHPKIDDRKDAVLAGKCLDIRQHAGIPMSTTPRTQPVLVKRYAGSRLYNTTNRCYVSVEQLRNWASTGVVFSVIDGETGADVTRVLLA